MTSKTVFKAGTKRLVHVSPKVVQTNLSDHKNEPMIGVRPASNPHKVQEFHRICIQGSSILIPKFRRPLPGTDGRAICYIITSAKLICYRDE